MNRLEIKKCEDIEELKRLCIAQDEQLTFVSEILVSESKWHITSDEAVRKIRDYLVKHQGEIHCNCTDEEIAKSFIEDVKAVEDLLPQRESEE